ncbi:MAG: glycerol-3-phosphate acyltransferase [Oscillospiraceae bacterium]|nr:glycerol-3-phosphate acyltransferase [Oscillospiraceae bacterium]
MWYPILITALACYLLGNLNGSVCVSTLIAHDDVRSHGSGNAGLTNFIRNFGRGKALLVALIDIGKTVIACLLGGLLLQPYGFQKEGMMLGAVAVSLGHDFPALLGFKGGKGILCGLAVAVVMDWRIMLILLAVFLICYLLTNLVSLGSVLAAVAFALCFLFMHMQTPWVAAGGVFLGLLALFMHRQNIARLIKGTESKSKIFGFRKKKL